LKRMTLLLFLLLSQGAYALPEDYSRNDDVKTDVSVSGDAISFTFGFHDPKAHTWSGAGGTRRAGSIR